MAPFAVEDFVVLGIAPTSGHRLLPGMPFAIWILFSFLLVLASICGLFSQNTNKQGQIQIYPFKHQHQTHTHKLLS